MNPDGSGLRRLTDSTDVEILPAWSPDGQRVFYQVEPKNGRSILYSASAGGGDVRRVTDGSLGFNYPAVSPDGRRIVCNGPDFSVYIMNVDGSGVRRLTDDPKFDGAPSWGVVRKASDVR